MKKLMALLAALCMMALPFAGLAEMADVTGTWYLTGVESDGLAFDPAMLGMEMTMTLNTDGSALLESNLAETEIGSWVLEEGTVLVSDASGEAQAFTLEGEELRCNQEGIILVMSREENAPAESVESPVRTDAAEEEFFGRWNSAYMVIGGMQLPLDMMGLGMRIEMTQGEAILVQHSEEGEKERLLAAEFTGGAMELEGGELVLQLHENGMISLLEEQTGGVMYFEKAAE